MLPARLAHVAIRWSSKRLRPSVIPNYHRSITPCRLQSSSKSQNGRAKNKTWDKRKTEFNQEARWDGFLGRSEQVAKGKKPLFEEKLRPAVRENVPRGEGKNGKGIGQTPAMAAAEDYSEIVSTTPTVREKTIAQSRHTGLQGRDLSTSRRHKSALNWTPSFGNGAPISAREDGAVADNDRAVDIFEALPELTSDDELPTSHQHAVTADKNTRHSTLDPTQLAKPLNLAQQDYPRRDLDINVYDAKSFYAPLPFISHLVRDFTHKRSVMFMSNHERLMDSALIPSQEFYVEDSYIPLPRDSITRDLHGLDFNWLRNYAVLFARRLHAAEDLEPVIRPRMRKQFAGLVRQFRQSELETPSDRMQAMVGQAVDLYKHNFARFWPDLMVLIIRYMPGMAAVFLQASYAHIKPSFYMVADTIHYITRFYIYHSQTPDNSTSAGIISARLTPSDIVELILDIIPQCNHESKYVQQGTIALLLDHIDLQNGHSLFTGLRAFDSSIRSASCISFAHFFARHGEYESALDALEIYLDNGGSSEDLRLKQAASKILRWSIVHPQGYHDSGYIVSRFMEMGLQVGLYFQTTLIANAFDSKDAPTALNVFTLMREQGIEPDAQTYATLLKGLRHSKDEALINDVLGLSWAKVEETKDEFLANEVLYWHYAQHVRKASRTWAKDEKAKIHHEALQQLVSLYTAVFDRAPLDVLGFSHLVPLERWSPSASLGIRPSSFIMSIMILAYTRAMVLLTEDEDVAPRTVGTNYRMYQRWWHVATRWSLYPDIAPWIKNLFVDMMKTPHTFNIFMHALGAQPATLYRAITILQRMDIGTIGIATHSAESEYFEVIASPNLFSWSILLNAFARHGETTAAEKCLQTMQFKNVVPDEALWNTLVKAYAMQQDTDGVVSALRRKEDAGWGMDEDVVRTLTRVKDRTTLTALLKREARGRDTEITDEKLLGRSGDKDGAKAKYMTHKWRPDEQQTVGYEPGVGSRQVNYFDANRTMGLRKESWSATEDEDGPVGFQPLGANGDVGTRVLDGRGSFTLKSDKEEDWFEEDDDDGEQDGDFSVSTMDDTSRDQR